MRDHGTLVALLSCALFVLTNGQSSNATVSATVSASTSYLNGFSPSFAPTNTVNATPPLESSTFHWPITSYIFAPYPEPSDPAPIPGIFPNARPSNPPPVSSNPSLVPDFGPAWAEAWAKARALTSSFSLEQKIGIATGVFERPLRCVSETHPVIAENGTTLFPDLCLQDCPLGVRYADFVTAFPTGINTAATWNRALMRLRGLYMGSEFVGKGVNVALGPMMNMGRNAEGGRNWEGFGADPFLSGEVAYETILGMQQGGVQATAKHYVNNEQEYYRTMESSNVDDRTEHEVYLQPFLRAVMAGVPSVMCSYNLINDTYACENNRTLNEILKYEFGYQGFVQSDYQATMSTLSVIAGLDMSQPGDIVEYSPYTYFGSNITDYVDNGTIPESRVDDMANRIVASWYFLEQDKPSFPKPNFNSNDIYDPASNTHVDVQDDHYTVVREIGAASTILLKNMNNTLPLRNIRNMALIGSDAGPSLRGPNGYRDRGGDDGVLAMGWGSGSDQFPYLITPLESLQARARLNRTSFSWFLDDFDYLGAQETALGQGVAIVFVNSDSGEGYITVGGNEGDRNNLTAWHGGDELVLAIAAVNNNTVVVVHSVGLLIIEPWIEHPNVTAVLWAGLPGQEVGNSLADILYGDWNPSGRLPYTIAKNVSDYPSEPIRSAPSPDSVLRVDYTEGLFVDYRWFDAKNITPRYEFGYGLSYTTFSYSNLRITAVKNADTQDAQLIQNWEAGLPNPLGPGSSTALWLHTPTYEVTFDVTNTGSVYGGEIPQLYVHFPSSADEPPSVLKGFTNVDLNPAETQTVSIGLTRHTLSIWDVVAQGWRKPNGTITFTIGASSRDGRLYGTIPA